MGGESKEERKVSLLKSRRKMQVYDPGFGFDSGDRRPLCSLHCWTPITVNRPVEATLKLVNGGGGCSTAEYWGDSLTSVVEKHLR